MICRMEEVRLELTEQVHLKRAAPSTMLDDPTDRLADGESTKAHLTRIVQLLQPVSLQFYEDLPLAAMSGFAIKQGTRDEQANVRNLQQLYGMFEQHLSSKHSH